MEIRSAPEERGRGATLVVFGPDGSPLDRVALTSERVTIGRLPEANDIALNPDPQQLVTRMAHCAIERDGQHWFVVDGGSVNGTYLRRGATFERVVERTALRDGDVVCVVAEASTNGARRYFELAFQESADSKATRAVPLDEPPAIRRPECLRYDANEARLVLVKGDEMHEIVIRAQAHRLVKYMVERNAAAGGVPVLCTHDELMQAVWGDEPMHSRSELAKLVWELRTKLEPWEATHVVENEPRRGYRLRTCPAQ